MAYESLEYTHAVRLQPTDNHHICARRPSSIQQKVWCDPEPKSQGQHRLNPFYVPRLPSVFQRRTGARPPPPPAVIEPAKPTSYRPEPKKTETNATKAPDRPSSSRMTAPKSETSAAQPKPPETKPVDKKPSLKKEASDIFKSFGKTKAPTAKLKREETNTASTREDGWSPQSTPIDRYQGLTNAPQSP